MSLATPERVQRLQAALHAQAKGEPDYRFYRLYDKVYRPDILAFAYECCRAKRGAAGVDGQTFEDIEAYGVERWLGELAEDLKKKTYRPSAVRRVGIPKPDGRKRPLGIPTIRDRAAQRAAVLVLAPIFEADRGRKQRTTVAKDTGRGTPQGAPISPLLANIYIRRFVAGWRALGHEKRLAACIVNYADDFVICCRGTGAKALAAMRRMMGRLRLTVNEAKTRLVRVPGETFDFLGYTFGRCWSARKGRSYLGVRPSKKAVARLVRSIGDETRRATTGRTVPEEVARLNRLLEGWANYFSLGWVGPAYRAADAQTRRRLRQWLCAKHGVRKPGTGRFPDPALYAVLGLARLETRPRRNFPWAKA
jgi:hypothetical protein